MERLVAEFDKFQARLRQAEVTFGGVGDMQDQLAQLAVVATSPDRNVRVVAGAGGTVTDIRLTADALRQPAPALAATIMSTLREAVAESARRQAAIVDETVGAALGVTVSDQVQQAQDAPPRQPRQPDEEDDHNEDSVFRKPRY